MLIVTATNVTKEKRKKVIVRKNGMADYDIWVGINHNCIWRGSVKNHDRCTGAPELLRRIANNMEAE
jgi:hypothetical protein